MNERSLSIVIPAYNEAETIEETLREALDYFEDKDFLFEMVVVDDGSSDATKKIVTSLGKLYPQIRLIPHEKNLGKGQSIKDGIQAAKYSLCLCMDADNSFPVQDWEKFEERLREGSQVVIGSRHLPDSQIDCPQPYLRRLLGAGYRALCRSLLGLRVSDINCGFKAYRTDIAKKIYSQIRSKDWTFDAEALFLLNRVGIILDEVPVRCRHRDKKIRISPLITALRTLKSLLRLKAYYSHFRGF